MFSLIGSRRSSGWRFDARTRQEALRLCSLAKHLRMCHSRAIFGHYNGEGRQERDGVLQRTAIRQRQATTKTLVDYRFLALNNSCVATNSRAAARSCAAGACCRSSSTGCRTCCAVACCCCSCCLREFRVTAAL